MQLRHRENRKRLLELQEKRLAAAQSGDAAVFASTSAEVMAMEREISDQRAANAAELQKAILDGRIKF